MEFPVHLHPVGINLFCDVDMKKSDFPRLSKFEIVKRLFRRFSTKNLSEEEKLEVLRRLITKLTTSKLSILETKEALIRLISKIKK